MKLIHHLPLNRLGKALLWLFAWLPFSLAAQVQLQRVEPAFWWAGMAKPNLQLMVYGENIAEAEPKLMYPGVRLVSVNRLANPNYLILDLHLAEDVSPGRFDIVFEYQAPPAVLATDQAVAGTAVSSITQPLVFNYELKARRPGSAQRQGFSAKDTIYLITPDRFANGDPANDQVEGMAEGLDRAYKGGRHGGDIRGIIDNLDYIADMGFTQIWPMPLLENNQQTYSYHGYSTTDYYKIDPRFGTNQQYLQLSQQAKQRGIGLIMDVILNHIGSGHWWMQDLPSQDWLNQNGQASGGEGGNDISFSSHRRETLHDIHGVAEDRDKFSKGWFDTTMPDLNHQNPHLATYLIQNAIWWVEFADLSGIRVDTYSYSDMNFLSQWTRRLMQEYPNFNIVGEEWSVDPAIVSFWQRGKQRYSDYQSDLPSLMDFPLQQALVKGLTEKESWGAGIITLYQALTADFQYADPYNLVIFGDNHDMRRLHSFLNNDPALTKMALTYLATTRGIPQIYYGTEILMDGGNTDDHGILRADFPGGWDDDLSNGFTGQGLTPIQQDMQLYTKRLLNWRKESAAVHHGKLTHYSPEKGTYVYFRHTDGDKVMVILNRNEQAITLMPQRFNSLLQGHARGADVITGRPYDLQQGLSVAAKSAMVLQLDKLNRQVTTAAASAAAQ